MCQSLGWRCCLIDWLCACRAFPALVICTAQCQCPRQSGLSMPGRGLVDSRSAAALSDVLLHSQLEMYTFNVVQLFNEMLGQESAEDAQICRPYRSAWTIEFESQMQRCSFCEAWSSFCAAWSNQVAFHVVSCQAMHESATQIIVWCRA